MSMNFRAELVIEPQWEGGICLDEEYRIYLQMNETFHL